ncbi:hypothetical protein RHODO2019_10880 [Rhodococcus antarcticus]|uniref:Uncharacterized protein n=1 Tax=Rhodococcus antarcticus TaxID=2987751 RepID=A0ABY6NWF2_9NOCA|nr:hypothetical protein [Rhodococcus antarcticus]UZJ23712.1 hypothetical protein RHODO2019_10880 [Rhodococcus antarcticus]
MSRQRRRGQYVSVWRTELFADRRGNEQIRSVPATPHSVRAAFIPQRSSKAEVPGQQQINVTRMIVDATLEDVSLWSTVEWNGHLWDVVAPAQFHYGTRHTRHWSIDIRERP